MKSVSVQVAEKEILPTATKTYVTDVSYKRKLKRKFCFGKIATEH